MRKRNHRTRHENARQMARLVRTAWAYVQILRPFNLLLVAITQCILFYVVLGRLQTQDLYRPDLFYIFILITVIISGSGYLVNDIYDVEIDKINKPDLNFIPDVISLRSAWIYYLALVIIGAGLTLYMAMIYGRLYLFWIYPAAVFFLFIYARYFKSSVLIGNIMVSLFIALVSGILMVHSGPSITLESNEVKNKIFGLLGGYMLLSFLANLSREIIKDCEDIEGDQKTGIKTLPIVYGIPLSVIITKILMVLIIVFVATCLSFASVPIGIVLSVLMILPGYILLMLDRNGGKKHFSQMSRWLKLYMVIGLCTLIALAYLC
jgi:4-hydroxybenzoate polyprenyltransferase